MARPPEGDRAQASRGLAGYRLVTSGYRLVRSERPEARSGEVGAPRGRSLVTAWLTRAARQER